MWLISVTLLQIRKLQEVAEELEERLKNIADDMRQREAETEKLRQTIRNTPPNDPAYVRAYTPRVLMNLTVP